MKTYRVTSPDEDLLLTRDELHYINNYKVKTKKHNHYGAWLLFGSLFSLFYCIEISIIVWLVLK